VQVGIVASRHREDIIMEIRHLLVPTDFSESSRRALDEAVGLAQTFGAKLTLLHVVELPSYVTDGHTPVHVSTALRDDLQGHAQQELAKLPPGGSGAPVEIVRRVVVGAPHQQILAAAVAERVDWIVMATHGRTGLSHLVMGSVAERVVRTAPCPVLTIRPVSGRS
jgi:nucleotide-binding universal stress UspA family protein